MCTDVITQADSKKYKDWKIPFTEKSFIVQYDGTVKAGIKDLTKTQVSQKGETIIVRLPEVEITGIEIDNDSFEKLDESNNIFNPITVEDLNKAQKNLKEEMYQRALEKGILDMAKSNAEQVQLTVRFCVSCFRRYMKNEVLSLRRFKKRKNIAQKTR